MVSLTSNVNTEQQLKLQAFLDGELPEKEARGVAAWMARDAEATDLLAELRNTRRALAGFEPALRLPESREFYWSKIQREIEHLEPLPQAALPDSPIARLRRYLVPAGALAALAIIVAFAGMQSGWVRVAGGSQTQMTCADSGTFTYQNDADGTTLVWLTYPAESEFAPRAAH